jgi:hypothetical protein
MMKKRAREERKPPTPEAAALRHFVQRRINI